MIDEETNTELEVVEKVTFVEWVLFYVLIQFYFLQLAEKYKEFGATLEFVTNKSQEGSQFVKGFGGIGGLLRYKVDFQSLNPDSDEEYLSD